MRCLIVDDSAPFRDVAGRMLTRTGIEVVGTATNMAEALRFCADLQPDVILLDVDLGEDSGFEVARQLDQLDLPVRPVVILVSTYSEQDFAELIAQTPVAAFIPKVALSGDAVRAVIDRQRPVSGPRGR